MHDCNIRGKKPDSNIPNIDDPLVKLEENIVTHFNTSDQHLRDEFLNLNDIVIKRLEDENTRLQNKCKSLEDKVIGLEENLNSLEQYRKTNNIIFSDISECAADNALEATVASILGDIDVAVDSNLVEASQRFGKLEKHLYQEKS